MPCVCCLSLKPPLCSAWSSPRAPDDPRRLLAPHWLCGLPVPGCRVVGVFNMLSLQMGLSLGDVHVRSLCAFSGLDSSLLSGAERRSSFWTCLVSPLVQGRTPRCRRVLAFPNTAAVDMGVQVSADVGSPPLRAHAEECDHWALRGSLCRCTRDRSLLRRGCAGGCSRWQGR